MVRRGTTIVFLSSLASCSSSDASTGSDDAGRSIIPRGDASTSRADGGGALSDGGAAPTTGAVTLEQVSYEGGSGSGSFRFVVVNGTNRALSALTQVRVSFAGASGEMVFTVDNCKAPAAWSAAPGAKSQAVQLAAEDLTIPDRATLRVPCQSGAADVVGNGPGASGGSQPTKLELRGAHDDASRWTASGPVQ